MTSNFLSQRRQDILVLWLVGYTYHEIAARLQIAPQSVKNTLHDTKNMLEIWSRAELFQWAWSEGLIQEWADVEIEGVGA